MIDHLNLLPIMRCVMRHRGGWAARAEGCEVYGYGDTPEAAMVDACSKFLPSENALPRRGSLFDEDNVPVRRRKITE